MRIKVCNPQQRDILGGEDQRSKRGTTDADHEHKDASELFISQNLRDRWRVTPCSHQSHEHMIGQNLGGVKRSRAALVPGVPVINTPHPSVIDFPTKITHLTTTFNGLECISEI